MIAVRIEHDALGSVELPADALYGIQTARALENLSFSRKRLGSYPAYVTTLALVKQAAARANREAAVLDARLADAIEAAAPAVGDHLDHFPVDLLAGGGSIAVNMNLNEVLANLANEHLGSRRGAYEPVHPLRHVNASQSTADVCHTALRLAVLRGAEPLSAALGAAAQTLAAKAAAWAFVPTLSRTCLQDALPTTVDVLLGGHTALLRRRAAALAAALAPLSAQLALLAEALLKVAQDLRLLASGPSGGFAELTLPHVQSGSSFFAGKVNPVVAETVMQCAVQVLGCDRAVHAACARAELHLNVFDGLAAVNVLDALDMLAVALERFESRCLRGLEVNEARCRELATRARSVTGDR